KPQQSAGHLADLIRSPDAGNLAVEITFANFVHDASQSSQRTDRRAERPEVGRSGEQGDCQRAARRVPGDALHEELSIGEGYPNIQDADRLALVILDRLVDGEMGCAQYRRRATVRVA